MIFRQVGRIMYKMYLLNLCLLNIYVLYNNLSINYHEAHKIIDRTWRDGKNVDSLVNLL